MDFGEFFRSFLGLGGGHRHDFPPRTDDDDCDCDENHSCPTEDNGNNEFHFFFGNRGHSMDDMFRHFHGDMHRQMESLHQQMEDMIKGFGTIASEPFGPRPSVTEKPESQPDKKSGNFRPFYIHPDRPHPGGDKSNPRDFMLKDDEDAKTPNVLPALPATPHEGFRPFGSIRKLFPWNQPSQEGTKDSDLDGKFSSDDVVEMIKKSNGEKTHQNSPRQGFFSGSSVTVTTVRGPDGKTEHKRVVRDSSGREEVAVSRSVDGQCHTVTTITGPDGLEERREDFKNMDQNDMQKFQEKWDTHQPPLRHPTPPILGAPHPPVFGPPHPPVFRPSKRIDPRDMDLFSTFFGNPPK